ncbi:MAG: T9SS type A sorting domain-containing protein [Lentimicrobium sp.]|nr:T9SS type A sorting domain-containing protein [Lentimicrobium sp.]
MKQKLLLLTLLLVFRAAFPELKAQSLVIRHTDGTENAELLNTVQKVTFSVNELLLSFKTGTTDVYGLSTIQKLYFDNETSIDETAPASGSKLSIYPNPANSTITVLNIPKGTSTIFLYRSDGELLMQQTVSNDSETIDISSLQSGLYFLTTAGNSVKFIKL